MKLSIPFLKRPCDWPAVGGRSRWLLEVRAYLLDADGRPLPRGAIELRHEVEEPGGGPWRPRGKYLSAILNSYWEWGTYHGWYDGPHCSYELGFLHLYRSWNSCDKCLDGA